MRINMMQSLELEPFNPANFIYEGWKFDPNESPLVLPGEIDLSKIGTVSMLKEDEGCISGEENLTRLKDGGHIRLGAAAFLLFWENQKFIPGEWKRLQRIFFDEPFLDERGRRCVLCLYWDGWWLWDCLCVEHGRGTDSPSAVLTA